MNKSPIIFTIRSIYKKSRWLYNTGNRIHIVNYRNRTVCGLALEDVDKDNLKSSTKEIDIVCKRCNHRKYDYIKRVQFNYEEKV
ncbi:hypothetical protein DRO61_04900 [Candidatus Bathyarchaeota archaeon]|nr:MAG: hypothetical protein DRO61_04900 [Candidatus Bathyarchaeota archaeon]